jgi:hypothetical protein
MALNLNNLSITTGQRPNDQLIFMAFNRTLPEEVVLLPDEWNVEMTSLWRANDILDQRRNGVGMFHFNGGGASKVSYFQHEQRIIKPKYPGTWDMVEYYIKLPWPWAKYMVECMIDEEGGDEGYALTIRHG